MKTINPDGTTFHSRHESFGQAFDAGLRSSYETEHEYRMEKPRKAAAIQWLWNMMWVALGFWFGG